MIHLCTRRYRLRPIISINLAVNGYSYLTIQQLLIVAVSMNHGRHDVDNQVRLDHARFQLHQ